MALSNPLPRTNPPSSCSESSQTPLSGLSWSSRSGPATLSKITFIPGIHLVLRIFRKGTVSQKMILVCYQGQWTRLFGLIPTSQSSLLTQAILLFMGKLSDLVYPKKPPPVSQKTSPVPQKTSLWYPKNCPPGTSKNVPLSDMNMIAIAGRHEGDIQSFRWRKETPNEIQF